MYDHVAYISGPLRVRNGEYGPFTPYQLQKHIRIAEHWAIVAWKAGWACICPHLNTLAFDGSGVDSEQFIRGDIAFIARLKPKHDSIIMLPDWRKSEGAGMEHEVARDCGLHIVEVESFRCQEDMVHNYLWLLREGIERANEYAERVLATGPA